MFRNLLFLDELHGSGHSLLRTTLTRTRIRTCPSHHLSNAQPTFPRHAASDFSKTASNRLTVMVEGGEATLCSLIDIDEGFFDDQIFRDRVLAALAAGRDGSVASEGDYIHFLDSATREETQQARASAAAWA